MCCRFISSWMQRRFIFLLHGHEVDAWQFPNGLFNMLSNVLEHKQFDGFGKVNRKHMQKYHFKS